MNRKMTLLLFFLIFSLKIYSNADCENVEEFCENTEESDRFYKTLASSEQTGSDEAISMANLEGEPSAFVNYHVNAITGDYNDFQVDLILPGVEPLVLERSFSGNTENDGSLAAGWNLNLFGKLSTGVSKESEGKTLYINATEGHGASTVFEKLIKKDKTRQNLQVSKSLLEKGVTNTATGYISGQTNIKNLSVSQLDSENYRISNGSGGYKDYRLSEGFSNRFRLRREFKPSGYTIGYHYLHNNVESSHANELTFDNLWTVDIVSPDQQKMTASLTYVPMRRKEFKKFPHQDITACDGRTIRYHMKRLSSRNNRYESLLTKVERSDGPTESYTYVEGTEKVGQLIKRKDSPNGRFLQMSYYKKGVNYVGQDIVEIKKGSDLRINRVKMLKEPAGVDQKPVVTQRFFYHFHYKPGIKEPFGGYTEVFDALGRKTLYFYDKNQRLKKLEKYEVDNSLYSKERLVWGANDTPVSTCLMLRYLESKAGEVVFARSYKYDNSGNILEDRLFGNLSGTNTAPLVISKDKIIDQPCESYCKHCTYSADGFNLLLWEGDDSHSTSYQYAPGSNRLLAKFTGSHEKICQRAFYDYYSDASLAIEIIDDGSSWDKNNLDHVTERYIKCYAQRQSYPYGVPDSITEYCLDLASGQEILIHKTVNTYTSIGQLAKEDHYDNTGSYAYSISWEYDAMGNVIKEIDALGRITFRRYDENSNCVYEQGPNLGFYKEYTYDFMNRLIRAEEIHSDGVRRVISTRYNLLGDAVATIDANGNETVYEYDTFRRVTKIIYPTVLNESGQPYRPFNTKSYDVMGNVISAVDGKNNETRMSYTIRGQLASVQYADGSHEKNSYNLDGSLSKSYAKNGVMTAFTYDELGRATLKEAYAPSGELLITTRASYSGFHMLSETDAMGQTTDYSYYQDGKLKSTKRGGSLTTFTYDALGRLYQTIEHFGPHAEDVIIKVKAYDLLNRVVEERVEDHSGKVLSKIQSIFDTAGNVCEVRTGDGGITSTVFDSHGTAIKVCDAEGNQIVTTRFYNYSNELGQYVDYKEVNDPLGNVTASMWDAMGRLVSVVRKNSVGWITQKLETAYDANGNPGRLIDKLISPEGSDQEMITVRHYDCANRLNYSCEAVGTTEQKQVVIDYNSFGQKSRLVKGDGSTIAYAYDLLGRLSRLHSSDGTVDYAYHYDLSNHPIRVDDLVNTTSTIKRYDINGRLIEEKLGNGYTLQFAYDRSGRLAEINYPDGTGASYTYRGCHLHSVARLKEDGSETYSHTYDSFNLAGQVLESHLIGNAGTQTYQYSRLGRLIKSSASHWTENHIVYDAVGNLLEKSVEDCEGTSRRIYCYDTLYQLTAEDGVAVHQYSHDSLNNRKSKDGNAHIHNALHQILNDGSATYAYDANGNLINKLTPASRITYEYDALDRLIVYSSPRRQNLYTYDENNRRLKEQKFVKINGEWILEKSINFLYQMQNEIGAIDSNGKMAEFRLLGIGKGAEIGAAVALEIGGAVYAPLHDSSGNVVCLVDSCDGSAVESYRYSAFGEELFDEALCPWRFSSKRTDAEIGLVYFGERYYDASLGRWISQDPLGRDDGPNLYAYVLNGPLTHFDLYGQFGLSEGMRGQLHGLWNSFSNHATNFMTNMIKLPGWTIEQIGMHLIPVPGLKDIVEGLGWVLQGKSPTTFIPCGERNPSQLCFHQGYGNTFPNVRYLMYNGICTEMNDFKKDLAQFSEENGGVDVYGIYNGTHGFVLDMIEVPTQKIGFKSEAQTSAERETRKIVSSMGKYAKDAILYVKAHSQGCETVHNLSPYLKKMMYATGYGPAHVFVPKDFKGADNFVGMCDFVTLFADPIGLCKGLWNGNVKILRTKGCPLFDHFINGRTYSPISQKKGQNNKNQYGSVECVN